MNVYGTIIFHTNSANTIKSEVISLPVISAVAVGVLVIFAGLIALAALAIGLSMTLSDTECIRKVTIESFLTFALGHRKRKLNQQ